MSEKIGVEMITGDNPQRVTKANMKVDVQVL